MCAHSQCLKFEPTQHGSRRGTWLGRVPTITTEKPTAAVALKEFPHFISTHAHRWFEQSYSIITNR